MKEEPESASEQGQATGDASVRPVAARYAHTYDHYARQYGKGLRTIKRWVAIGKSKGEFCPLDDPAKLPGWWGRCMEYSIPAEVLAVCSARPPSNDEAPPSSGEASGSGRALINLGDLAAIGLKENVERLSKIHRANLELLERAFAANNDADLQLRQRNAEKSARMLSDAQRNYDEYQKVHGELVVLADVKRELLRVHASMAQSLVSIFVGLGISRDRAVASADTWFKHLRESRFASGTAPELVRAPVAA